MSKDHTPFIAPLALIATASGARTMTGIAAVARARAAAESAEITTTTIGPRIVRRVAQRFDHDIASAATALALFEMMADKAPGIPDRIDPGPLFGRVAAGAVVGATVAQLTGHDRKGAAIAGAVVAFIGAHLSFRLRRSLSRVLPPFVAGLVEDAAVVGLAAAGTTFLGPRRSSVS